MIYLDWAASAIPYADEIETAYREATAVFANPSAQHGFGKEARNMLEKARSRCAAVLGISPETLYFTSGASESNSLVLLSLLTRPAAGSLVISNIEHPSVREQAAVLEHCGWTVLTAPSDKSGCITPDAVLRTLRKDTVLVAIMGVNNEIGSIQPIQAISELLADKPTISFHVDAVQALAKIPTEKYLTDRVDFATFSSHKFHGVRGVGFVYIKSGKKITPLLTGGGQERDYRSTTENVAGIAATAKALRLAMEKLDLFTAKTAQMKAVIRQALLEYPDIFVFSGEEDFAPHILTFGIKGVRGEVIVHAFEDYDIFISTTSACSSKAGKPAGTLIAMGVDKDKAQSAVRLSLDLENDMSQVEQFLTKLKLIYNQTRKVR